MCLKLHSLYKTECRCPEPSITAESQISPIISSARPNLLVVEDDHTQQAMIARYVSICGRARHDFAFTGEEAIVKIYKHRDQNAILLTDYSLGKMLTGADLVWVAKKAAFKKVVGMSSEQENSSTFMLAGADGFLLKPVTLHDIETLIE